MSLGIAALAAPVYALALWGARKTGAPMRPVKFTSAVVMIILTGLSAALSAWVAGTVYTGLAVSVAMIAACFVAARLARGRWIARRGRGHVASWLLVNLADARVAAFAVTVVAVTYLVF